VPQVSSSRRSACTNAGFEVKRAIPAQGISLRAPSLHSNWKGSNGLRTGWRLLIFVALLVPTFPVVFWLL